LETWTVSPRQVSFRGSGRTIKTLLRGRDAVEEIRNTTGDEVEARMKSLRIKFSEWWQKYREEIQKATIKFQDSLFNKSISMGQRK
jgi:hypothetical protein